MSTPEQDPIEVLCEDLTKTPFSEGSGEDRLPALRQASDVLRAKGEFFAAGYGMARCVYLAWGDVVLMQACVEQASRDFEQVVIDPTRDALERVAALIEWKKLLSGVVARDAEHRESQPALDLILSELLTELASAAGEEHERTGYLIRGFTLTTDFRSGFRAGFPGHEVAQGWTMVTGGEVTLSAPGAFGVLLGLGDYSGAQQVADAFPLSFVTPGLRGWRAAVSGFNDPERAVEHFREAAEHFSQDTQEASPPGQSWSSINIDLWSKYFAARADIAEIIRSPDNASELIRRGASVLEGTESGWVDSQVTCLRVVLDVLNALFSADHADVALATRQRLELAARLSGVDESNAQATLFLDEIAVAYDELRGEPAKFLTSGSLGTALRTLGRIPLFGEPVAEAITPFVGELAFKALEGQQRTWIYRTLEGITDEAVLRRVLYRLFQASGPHYAQIRHGPIEYGKDIAVLAEVDGENVLSMYQVKIGDIGKSSWPNAARELEEIFQVPMSDVQLPVTPDRVEGCLVFNGHLNSYVEPVVGGWLHEQARDHGRTVRLMHLDDIVTWIVRNRLIGEFRAACNEFGVPFRGI